MSIIELHAVFKGKVQRVGFRWTVVEHACSFHLVGWVKNLPNGNVEMVAQGKKEDLERLVEIIKGNPGLATINQVESRYRDPSIIFEEFKIEHYE